MNTAAQYARALYELVEEHPQKSRTYVKNLRGALARRGHEKLLPRVFSEYQKLETAARRSAAYAEVTPQMERTDKLLQLYRRLITAK